MLKYLRKHAIPKVTIAGGFAKMTKLGQGLLDLHSKRGEVDLSWLTARCVEAGASDALIARVKAARSAGEVLELARVEGFDIAAPVAKQPGTRRRGLCMAVAFRLKSLCSTAKPSPRANTVLPVH